jgi:hypothetical protein
MAKNQGIKSRNVARKPMHQGAPRQHVHPGAVAQEGQHVGNKAMNQKGSSYRGEPLLAGAGYQSELGNKVAEQTTAGPGGSRTIYKSGFQQTHGSVNPGNPMQAKGEIFSGFGPRK